MSTVFLCGSMLFFFQILLVWTFRNATKMLLMKVNSCRDGSDTAIPVTRWQVTNRIMKMHWWDSTVKLLSSLWKTGESLSNFLPKSIHLWFVSMFETTYYLFVPFKGLSRHLSTVCWVRVEPTVAGITGSASRTGKTRESTAGSL